MDKLMPDGITVGSDRWVVITTSFSHKLTMIPKKEKCMFLGFEPMLQNVTTDSIFYFIFTNLV